jgi:mono/diheme cytochrome c family protein
MRRTLASLAVIAALAAAIGAGVVGFGVYDVSAYDQHLAPTYWLLDFAKRRAVAQRASAIRVPPLDDDRQWRRGIVLYDGHCVPCHGAPGAAPAPFALSMLPTPANLSRAARDWSPAELYWTIRYGLKMTGMPSWEFRLPDADLWAIVAFLRRMPGLSPRQYAELLAGSGPSSAASSPGERDGGTADAARGRTAIAHYACVTCHQIPGVVGDNAPVGPPLEGIARRGVIAGRLDNTPANMVAWLRAPKQVNPESAMPDLGVSERDARDIAAYLRTLR